MTIYARSGTDMDRVGMFFPQSFLAGRRGLRGLGDVASDPGGWASLDWQLGTPGIVPGDVYPVPASDPGFTATGGLFSSITQGLSQLLAVGTQAKAQSDLMDLNLERARRGLPPISGAAIAPQVNVGVAPGTMRAAGFGLGTLLLVAAGVYLVANSGANGGARRRRSRRRY